MLALFSEVVRDAWRQQHRSDIEHQRRVDERLDDLQRRKNRLVDAYLHERKIDDQTYREQLDRVEREMEEVRDRQHATAVKRASVDAALDFAPRLLADPGDFWAKLPPDRRPVLQDAIYPTGLTYSDGEIGTAETSLIFSYFGEIDAAVSEMASPAGIEPASPA